MFVFRTVGDTFSFSIMPGMLAEIPILVATTAERVRENAGAVESTGEEMK